MDEVERIWVLNERKRERKKNKQEKKSEMRERERESERERNECEKNMKERVKCVREIEMRKRE